MMNRRWSNPQVNPDVCRRRVMMFLHAKNQKKVTENIEAMLLITTLMVTYGGVQKQL